MIKNQVDGNQMITFTIALYMVLESTLCLCKRKCKNGKYSCVKAEIGLVG